MNGGGIICRATNLQGPKIDYEEHLFMCIFEQSKLRSVDLIKNK